jgi:hypothetical protein
VSALGSETFWGRIALVGVELAAARRPIPSRASALSFSTRENPLYCSFCGKSQHEVRKFIAGPTVFICDECVELCLDIIGEENKSSLTKSGHDIPTPQAIRKALDVSARPCGQSSVFF